MPFPLTDSVQVQRRANGEVHQLDHLQQPFLGARADERVRAMAFDGGVPTSTAETAQELANDYLREVAPIYGFPSQMVPGVHASAAALDPAPPAESALTVTEVKQDQQQSEGATVSYQQMYRGMPVINAGTKVFIHEAPLRVTASESTVNPDIHLTLPDHGPYEPGELDDEILKKVLGLYPAAPLVFAKEYSQRLLVYRFKAADRVDPAAVERQGEGLEQGPPTLPLPELPRSIEEGGYFVVAEANFQLPTNTLGELNWVAYVEVSTGAVLYLRARVGCASGLIFPTDPFTAGSPATVVAEAPTAILNPLRKRVTLAGINGTAAGQLVGNFVKIEDIDPPSVEPPTVPDPPATFEFDAPARAFAAVNAYHHCDALFRRMEEMGFNVSSYFDGTTFPVRVDPCAFNDQVNALAPGNLQGTGSDGFRFGLAGASPCVGIAADARVPLHEFGHALLWDNVHSPNFGFAHSAGDSLAAILMDPESQLRNDPDRRFNTFPWVLPNRRHDRRVADGWGWDGARYGPFTFKDAAGYIAEQILSTTLFRFYRAIGGDADDVASRTTAARRAVYLIFRAIGSLGSAHSNPTSRPESFATALINADVGIRDFEGYKGGASQKVLRWGFEKQGLYQPAGAPMPVTGAGAPPAVDVFIEDGRHGEYDFAAEASPEIWNRQSATPGAGPQDHEPPRANDTNFLFVRIQNRGSQPAQNVQLLAYVADPASRMVWPDDFTALANAPVAAADVTSGQAGIAGPFEWHPRATGGDAILVAVSATGDLSNIDPLTFFPCAAGPSHAAELVRTDNNLALRVVASE